MKSIIYLRTSTKEQNPELQREHCIDFCSRMGLDVVDVVSEKSSAYKLEKIREKWESLVERAKKEKLNIVVWRYDRAFRNREEFFKFIKVMFEVYNVKVYSVTEPSILSFWEMMDKSHSENPIFNELLNGIFKAMWDFMIQQAGEQAEEESKKKSERIKLAVKKENGITKSYKGKRWGRKSINKNVINRILELSKTKTMREIAKEIYYYDKSNNKKNVSLAFVHKTISQNKGIGDK
jgi:DNA invertase Pin-like site-specific DNA recombinase